MGQGRCASPASGQRLERHGRFDDSLDVLRTIASMDLDTSTAIHVAASKSRYYRSSWDHGLSFGTGAIIGVSHPGRAGVTTRQLSVFQVDESFECIASYVVDVSVPCGDLDGEGGLVIADRARPDEPRGALTLRTVGRGGARELAMEEVNGWPMALRVTGRGRALLWLGSSDPEMLLVDLTGGHVLHRVAIEANGSGESMVEMIGARRAVAIGHGACQEHDFEVIDVANDRLLGRDWLVSAPEGLCVVGADGPALVTIERSLATVVRRRDLETGDVLAERPVPQPAPAYLAPGSRDSRGWLVTACGLTHGDAIVRIRAEDLMIEEVGPLPAEARVWGWPHPDVALVADMETASIVRVE